MSNRYKKKKCITHKQPAVNSKYEKFLLDLDFLLDLGFLESYCKNWDKIDRENLKFKDRLEEIKTKKKPWKNQGITFF